MTRTFRLVLVIYALSFAALSVATRLAHSPSTTLFGWWLGDYAVPCAYLALVIGSLFSKNEGHEPSTPWVIVTFGFSLSLLPVCFQDPIQKADIPFISISLACLLGYLAFSGWLYMHLRRGHISFRPSFWWSALAAGIVGSSMVLSTLFMDTTTRNPGFSQEGADTGWGIVLGRTPWVTTRVNIASLGNDIPTIPWLQHFYVPGGYIVYLLALAASVALFAWLVTVRPSIKRVDQSRALAGFVFIFSFFTFWIYTDIFWGWQSLLAEAEWLAVLATALWLCGPILALITLFPVAAGQDYALGLRIFLLLQVPIGAFNYLMLGNVVGLDMPGLAVLMVGLQLESWACIGLLALMTGQNQTEPLSDSHEHERRLRASSDRVARQTGC